LLAGFGWQLIVVLVLSTTLTLLLPGLLLKLLLARHRHQEGA
jgi:holin-like protein